MARNLSIPVRKAIPKQSKPGSATAYLSPLETTALLVESMAARKARLEAGDMMSSDEAADYAGVSRVTINAWISKGRAIGLAHLKRGYKLPSWQFEPAIWDVIPLLSQALQTVEGWTLLSFLESPSGALDGDSPRTAIEQGRRDRVLELAASSEH